MPISPRVLLPALMTATIPLSCGSAQGARADDGASGRGGYCETSPAAFATAAYRAALTQGLEGMLARYSPGRELFGEMVGATLSADEVEGLWQAHRSDLGYGVESVRRCGGREVRITKVDSEEAPAHIAGAYEVHVATTCADGTSERLKLKMVLFRGCLRLGAID